MYWCIEYILLSASQLFSTCEKKQAWMFEKGFPQMTFVQQNLGKYETAFHKLCFQMQHT